ncbi:PKD domain-containing protein [Reichenbachiella agarivorans]|uniref:PKD domain-containing protein n=1 Tax=Reichenbachiella agarivorans TaxID=2979464 RepID=A0ABY6CRF6_9BACT|nr:PKD domain-containing protein [Reichenbachiella agarivorans]UXP33096.1 PKD domain-containing protein [Reichenbachiella agarivorans]
MSVLIFATSCGEDDGGGKKVDPVASFTAQVEVFEVTFYNTSEGAVSYAWNFGDDATSTDQNVIHTYASPGDYTVTLTITGADGTTSTAENVVSIVIPEAAFKNGNFDLYASDSPDYQLNNDDWEPVAENGWVIDEAVFRAGGMTTDGKLDAEGNKTNGIKYNAPNRGVYQVVDVTVGATYEVKFEATTEALDVPEVDLATFYMLSEIITNKDGVTDANTLGKVSVQSDPNGGKTSWKTFTFEFTATTDKVLFFGKSVDPVGSDSNREVWFDNFEITLK